MIEKAIETEFSEFSKLSIKNSATKELFEIGGWILTVIVPVLIYFLTPPIEIDGFGNEPKIFLCILFSAGVMWFFSLLILQRFCRQMEQRLLC